MVETSEPTNQPTTEPTNEPANENPGTNESASIEEDHAVPDVELLQFQK